MVRSMAVILIPLLLISLFFTRNLDDHPAFAGRFSTTEVVAGHICRRLRDQMDLTGFAALAVTLREHPDAWATCRVDLP